MQDDLNGERCVHATIEGSRRKHPVCGARQEPRVTQNMRAATGASIGS